MSNILTKSGKTVLAPSSQEKRNYNSFIYEANKMLKININYEFKNDKQAIIFSNKFKGLAKNPYVEININFIRI